MVSKLGDLSDPADLIECPTDCMCGRLHRPRVGGAKTHRLTQRTLNPTSSPPTLRRWKQRLASWSIVVPPTRGRWRRCARPDVALAHQPSLHRRGGRWRRSQGMEGGVEPPHSRALPVNARLVRTSRAGTASGSGLGTRRGPRGFWTAKCHVELGE